MEDITTQLTETLTRLNAAAEALEQTAARIAEDSIARITATVDTTREDDLMRRLTEAEQKLATLTASAARQTVSTATATMLSKHGLEMETLDATAIDAALTSRTAGLSIEQRIALKAELHRAGLIG